MLGPSIPSIVFFPLNHHDLMLKERFYLTAWLSGGLCYECPVFSVLCK